MTRSKKVSLASLIVVMGGGAFLTTPARAASDEGTFLCRDSVRSYCQWVADNYCSNGAVCTYQIATCTIVDAECY